MELFQNRKHVFIAENETEGPKKGCFQNKYAIPQNLNTHLVIMYCKGEWVVLFTSFYLFAQAEEESDFQCKVL